MTGQYLNNSNSTFEEWCESIEKQCEYPIDRYSHIDKYKNGVSDNEALKIWKKEHS